MSLARHNFANIVPTDKSKLGSRVYSSSQVTSMIKANANTPSPKRYAFGISAFYMVNSGLINDYRTLTGGDVKQDIIPSGALLDGNDDTDQLMLEGNAEEIENVLDGN